jgi:hypothetical protein
MGFFLAHSGLLFMVSALDEELDESFAFTVGFFESRLRQKIDESKEKLEAERKAASDRHALMLKAINHVRKVLTKASKVDLDKGYFLDLEVSDKEGWPLLELYLVNSRYPSNRDLALLVTATDRRGLGTVMFSLRSGENLGSLHFHDSAELSRLGPVVRRSVRVFLDCVAEKVTNMSVKDGLAGIQDEGRIDLRFGGEKSSPQIDLSSIALFADKLNNDENRVNESNDSSFGPLLNVSF